MSSTQIIAKLPALSPAELEAVWQRAGQLLEWRTLSGSPELLAAVDEADASWEQEELTVDTRMRNGTPDV